MRLFIIGAVIIGYPVFKLIRTIEHLIRHPVTDCVVKTTASIDHVDQMISHVDKIVMRSDATMDEVQNTLEEVKILLVKLQTASDRWNELVDVVELVPVKRKIKKIAKLPFFCCRHPKSSEESSQ